MAILNFIPSFDVLEIWAHSTSSVVDFFVNQTGKKQIIVHEGATLMYLPILVESSVDLELILDGVGAKVICSGFWVSQNDSVKSKILVKFTASKTTADVQLLWLPGTAECRLEWDLDIAESIEWVTSSLYQHQLVRGAWTVHMVALPKLHVRSHQVKAWHGASIHQLDPKYLFYLMAKWLDLEAAQHLVIRGQIEHLIDRTQLSDEEKTLVLDKLSPFIGS